MIYKMENMDLESGCRDRASWYTDLVLTVC